MFHQANVIPTDIALDDGTVVVDTSTLEYWYQVVLAKMARYLNLQGTAPFPVKVRQIPIRILTSFQEPTVTEKWPFPALRFIYSLDRHQTSFIPLAICK